MFKINIKKTVVATVVGGLICASQAQAGDFYFGEDSDIMLQINSQLSVGSSWQLKDVDPRFISALNGGSGFGNNADDGQLNFDKNDTFSTIVKGIHDIQLTKDNYGAFVRFKYWYDKELEDGNRAHGHSANGYQANAPLNDDGFSDFAKFSGREFLDAYIFSTFDLGDVPVDVRIGRQVVSWGESTFIQGGINSINPLDVSAFRRPGAELKEGLLPVGMVYANFGLTESISIEGFYQYEWEKTQIEGCGTYFSTNDIAADGCSFVSFKQSDSIALASGLFVDRQDDIEPENGGQFGLAVRYFAEELNNTEFGFYFMNIHARTPLINGVRTKVPLATKDPSTPFIPSIQDPTGGKLASLNADYRVEFVEDLQYYGMSFATNAGGWALSGEVSYKPDTPIQINGTEIINGIVSESPVLRFTPRVKDVAYGEMVTGYDEFDVTQLQVSALHFFERVLGASRLSLIGEAGLVLTNDIEKSDQHYGRSATFGIGNFDAGFNHPVAGFRMNCSNLAAAGAISGDCRDDGYVTDTAWGYRLRAALDYSNVFAGVSLKPTIAWSHDVDGYSPEPGQQFHEGRKSLGLSLEASYQQQYSATIGYTNFSGGSHNPLESRDFMSLSFTIAY